MRFLASDDTFGQGVIYVFFFLSLAIWGLRKLSKMCGADDAAKSAAARGVTSLLSRLFK